MTAAQLANQFRHHFGHRQHLYGVLLDELADDLEAGGPTAAICAEHLDAPRGDAVQLRLLAGIFRIVLRGEAPRLEPFYPSLGGQADPEQAWPEVRPALGQHVAELQRALDLAPQTNEVGRSACLAVGLFEAVRRTGLRRVRLLEPGASAGLNLLVDRYRMVGPGWSWGPADSELVLDTQASGVRPEELTIVERRGCDLAPVDASSADGATYLTSFVWPFDLARHARLAAALEIARRHPVTVDRAPASAWLAEQLAQPADDGVLTVVWQSITEQYWPLSEQQAVAATIDQGRARMPLVHVAMEGVPPKQMAGSYDIAEHGPSTTVDGDLVARSHHHGPPVLLR
ncbi:hypothetical protein ASC77_01190 [Nocardioides sp. Root1257]|uniref:DUF2332 domain-containing protein n=1 Tax=unclassified Nocardioides TaxID=2615069 RepID=UPI0006FFEBA4|nr:MULTISPECIES: DUF2332 domain-containing protein [unclassified Nocardioides]KQW52950.1 hypothetical protein ASC77_01190 [Nocardioides sp. Root1257]KRC55638.1 hypothetical protein ASE24_01190 [Nocardioides sp. Root224]